MIILGSTGSIGVNTLEIAKKFNIKVEVLAAGENIDLLNKQIKEFKPKYVVIKNKEDKKRVNFDKVFYSIKGILEVLNLAKSDIVINALVSSIGLLPTIEAIKLNKKVALANKESLVIGGKFIDISKITPIDSEHFGIWYLLNKKSFKKLLITASGGALRNWDIEKLKNAKLEDVLNHPNWDMGIKITIDSATMINKLFEILEAKWLFNTINIDALIEENSIIHALVEWIDGSTTAHISKTDMKLPIAYALGIKDKEILKNVDLLSLPPIKFKKIELNRYPIWQLKEKVLKNPDLGVVINSANDAAIEKFILNKIPFTQISSLILQACEKFNPKINSVDDIFEIEKEVKEFISSKK